MKDNKFIPLSVPNFQGNELAYVSETIKTEWVSTGGAFITRFEKEIAQYTGAAHAVACQNGTAGLHVSLLLLGVGANDEVIVPTLTFIAAVNPVRYAGAEPVFMDCDDSLCMDADKLDEFFSNECVAGEGFPVNKLTHKSIKALIYVHVFGNTGNFEKIVKVCRQHNVKIIEDATESLGTRFAEGEFAGRHTGTLGDIGVFSFNGNKIITTGGGGMLVTHNPETAAKAKYLTTQAKDDDVRFVHHAVGYNYRMTNIQAALGVAQLEQLDKFIKIKAANYWRYREGLDGIPGLKILDFNCRIKANYWFYSLQIESREYGLTREELMAALASAQIQSRPVWYLNHLQKPYLGNQAYRIEKPSFFSKEY